MLKISHNLNQNAASRARQRGTVMFEFLLVVPVLVVVLLLIFYFGVSMIRMQRTVVVDRYEAWREVDNGQGPTRNAIVNHAQLRKAILDDKPESMSLNMRSGFNREAMFELAGRSDRDFSSLAGDLVRSLIGAPGFDEGRRVDVRTRYHHDPRGILSRFDVPLRSTHWRIEKDWKFAHNWRLVGGEWRHADGDTSWLMSVLTNEFWPDYDLDLRAISANTNPLADLLRNMYMGRPHYDGPEVNP